MLLYIKVMFQQITQNLINTFPKYFMVQYSLLEDELDNLTTL